MRGLFLALAARAVCAYSAGASQLDTDGGKLVEPRRLVAATISTNHNSSITTDSDDGSSDVILSDELSKFDSDADGQDSLGVTCDRRTCRRPFKCKANKCRRFIAEDAELQDRPCKKSGKPCGPGYKCQGNRCKKIKSTGETAGMCIDTDKFGHGTPPSARPSDFMCSPRSYDDCDNQRWCKWNGPIPKQGCKVKEWNWHVGKMKCQSGLPDPKEYHVYKAPYEDNDQWCYRCLPNDQAGAADRYQSPCTQDWNNKLGGASCSSRYDPEAADLGYESCANQAYCEWYGPRPDDCGRDVEGWQGEPGCCLSEGFDTLFNQDEGSREAVLNGRVSCSKRDITTCNGQSWCDNFQDKQDTGGAKIISNVASWKPLGSMSSTTTTTTQSQTFSESTTESAHTEVSKELMVGMDVQFMEAGATITVSKSEEASQTFTYDFMSETSRTIDFTCNVDNGYLYLWELTTEFEMPDNTHGTVTTPSNFIFCQLQNLEPQCPPTGPNGCDGTATLDDGTPDPYCQTCLKNGVSKGELACDAKCAKIMKWDWPTKCTWKKRCGGCPECKV